MAVIGVPDEKWGERIKAVVVLNNGFDPGKPLEKDIIDFARDKIAGHKRPKEIEFISAEEMPKTATGKMLHRVLRSRSQKLS